MSFAIEYNNLTIGEGTSYVVSNLNPGELDVRLAQQLAAGRDGGYIFNANYGMRVVSFNVSIVSNSSDDLFDKIDALRNAFVKTSTAQPLKITYWADNRVRQIDVIPSLLPNPVHTEGLPQISENIRIELIAPFPFYTKDDSDIITETLYLSQSEGFDYSVTYPFDYTAGSANNQYIFNNDTQLPALLKITFSGDVINPTLTNTSEGLFAQIEATLQSGEAILQFIPGQGRSITDGSGNSLEQVFIGSTSFFFLNPGYNTLVFSASTYSSLAQCEIEITKYYLS